MSNMTLGSLFDGSGGFPLGGMLAGITPVWASEIEPFPIRVTTKRLPFMKHYGNVSEMDGGKVEPVDIITFGSPCQDMSVAGKRAGLEGSRSNLFYEAVRIIKEMRKATGGEYPKWACWENVPGAFSSSGGEDFRCVLESLCGVIDESVSIPKPKKWANAGEILGDGYSLAWRVLDAQFWGVPQRRKRIYLVADFTGGCAGKVLFESESLSGYSPQGFRSWQTAPGDSANCSGTAGIGFDGYNAKLTDDKSATLATNNDQTLFVPAVFGICSKDSNAMKSDNPNSGFYKADTTRTLDANGGNPSCNQGGMAVVAFAQNQRNEVRDLGTKAGCISAEPGMKQQTYVLRGSMAGRADRNGSQGSGVNEDVSFTLDATDRHAVAYGIDRATYNMGQNAKFAPCIESEVEPPMVARGPGAVAHPVYSTSKNSRHTQVEEDIVNTLVATDYKEPPTVTEEPYYIVRRLTPTECARLQGFPDWWCSALGTDEPSEEDVAFWREVFETHRAVTGSASKPKTDAQIMKWLKDPHADSSEYKLWGNGVALPCVCFVLSGIVYFHQLNAERETSIRCAGRILLSGRAVLEEIF